jgi:hypothetical protein
VLLQLAEEWRYKLTRLKAARKIQRAFRYYSARHWLARTLDEQFERRMVAQKKILERLQHFRMDNSLAGQVLVLFGVPARYAQIFGYSSFVFVPHIVSNYIAAIFRI